MSEGRWLKTSPRSDPTQLRTWGPRQHRLVVATTYSLKKRHCFTPLLKSQHFLTLLPAVCKLSLWLGFWGEFFWRRGFGFFFQFFCFLFFLIFSSNTCFLMAAVLLPPTDQLLLLLLGGLWDNKGQAVILPCEWGAPAVLHRPLFFWMMFTWFPYRKDFPPPTLLVSFSVIILSLIYIAVVIITSR